jgi:hypothetical protein
MNGAIGRMLAIAAVASFVACRPAPNDAARRPAAPGNGTLTLPGAGADGTSARVSVEALKTLEAKFRAAVLGRDVAWVATHMDPSGWECGDAEMSAADYAAAFREGHMDFALLFDGEVLRSDSIVPNRLAYREWFQKCPSATAEEEAETQGGEKTWVVTWKDPACPEREPSLRVVQRPAGLFIRVFGECL